MIRAVILLTLAACASSKSAEQHTEVAGELRSTQEATQSVQQETHSEEGEWTRRTWEFGQPAASSNSNSAGQSSVSTDAATTFSPNSTAQPTRPSSIASGPGSTSHTSRSDSPVNLMADSVTHPSFLGWPMDGDAPLLRYTEETHAPAHVDTTTVAGATQQGTQSSTLNASSEAHSASKRSYWPPVTYLFVGLLAATAGLWLARGKLKLALGVLGRIF